MINNKNLNILLKYIENISNNSSNLIIKENPTKEDIILVNLSCLIEEVGELSSEIRKMTKMSFNKEKVKSFKKENLEEEIIDVLICNLLIAKECGINDLNKAIIKKIEKNNKRGY